MKKYTENIESLISESKYTEIDKKLKSEVQDLYRKRVTSPAFSPGGLKTGEPTAIQVLQTMQMIIDKYATRDERGTLILKDPSKIHN